jgi:phage shock protein A
MKNSVRVSVPSLGTNVLISQPMIGQNNLAAKAALKATKADVENHYNRIQSTSASIEHRLGRVKARLQEGAQKIQEIHQMQRELAMIRATYPPHKACADMIHETTPGSLIYCCPS